MMLILVWYLLEGYGPQLHINQVQAGIIGCQGLLILDNKRKSKKTYIQEMEWNPQELYHPTQTYMAL